MDFDVNFSIDPGWIGVNNDKFGNDYRWVTSVDPTGKRAGEVGGRLARHRRGSSFGDTNLGRSFTLNDPISASGYFAISDRAAMNCLFFIGHYSSSAADNRREFIGLEFGEAANDAVQIRARVHLAKGTPVNGAMSPWFGLEPSHKYHFDYSYDPTFEADGSHAGPEGKISLHVFRAGEVDKTFTAALEQKHRDSVASFDAFGIGAAPEAVLDDDADKSIQVSIDNVCYSGLQANSGAVGMGQKPLLQMETSFGAIEPSGYRFDESEPDEFPRANSGKQAGYAAGSFEYSTIKSLSK
jgi:hypothetical protein